MSLSPISNLQSILGGLLNANPATGKSSNSSGSIGAPAAVKPDNSQLSPFAQLMSVLQQLQQSDPAQYKQVTQQIASNLTSAAQTATAEGNTSAASQLNQLSSDFTGASQSGQLPNVQDLAQATGGHHHHHHSHASSAGADGSSDASSGASQLLNQFLANLQPGSSPSDALNPTRIILNTLSNAGITAS